MGDHMSTTIDIQTTETQPFILLPVFVNGKGPFSFVLDTGANAAIVTEDLAKTLALQNVEAKEAVGAGGKRTSVLVGQASSISVGAAKVENAKVGIMKTLPTCVGQGVVGYDFLKQYVVTIDYMQNKLTLTPSEEHNADDHMLHASMPLKLPRPDRPLILVDVLVNIQKTYQFALDTGASQTVVSPVLAEQMGMMSAPGDTLIGAAGAVTSSSGILKSLRIGDTSIEDVPVMISDIFSPLNQAVGTIIDGILGYNVLRRFSFMIDYPNGRLHFRRLF
jgi:predicted aspartyl protease